MREKNEDDGMNIYLVGFMGSGKSTVGRILARRLGRDFVETDDEIEIRSGMKISELFSRHGEEYFRTKEKETLEAVSKIHNLVVSCGGGVVIDKENRKLLESTGVVICLEADVESIYERVKHSGQRPLLNVESPKEKIQELLIQRQRFYREARYCVNTVNLTPTQVAENILEILKDGKEIITTS